MSLVRLIVAWLVMAALPLQGLAAASMLFCGQASHATAAPSHASGHASHAHAAHDHAGHDPARDGVAMGHAHGAALSSAQPADGHACPICAACCNQVALSATPLPRLGGNSAPTPAPAGPSHVATRDAPAPDKPPCV